MKVKYLILGAGPAGLTFANRLLQNGEEDFMVLEKEARAGGLCRSSIVGNAPLDIGGGHFLDVRKPGILEFLFSFMPINEWNLYERDSRISIQGEGLINHPLEANIWQMTLRSQVDYLKSIAQAGCNQGKRMPEEFIDWIYWKLGSKIADTYMVPYNKKIFGNNLNLLGTYWLEKLPSVSFEETLISCLERKAYGTEPGHAKFYYPKQYGYGELWDRMARRLDDRIQYNTAIKEIDFDKRCVNKEYQAETIILTIPWKDFNKIGMPNNLNDIVDELQYSSVVIEYKEGKMNTKAQWIYYPDLELDYHRILVRHNFCPDSSGYWTETNLTRFDFGSGEKRNYFINKYAYPLNTIGKNQKMAQLVKWAKSKNVIALGRWGEWQHYNSDVVVDLALKAADEQINRKE